VLARDPNHKIWFIHDHHLILPEYLIEFEYAQDLPNGDNVFQFGEKLAFLEKKDGEFLTPNNYDDYKGIINEIFNELSD